LDYILTNLGAVLLKLGIEMMRVLQRLSVFVAKPKMMQCEKLIAKLHVNSTKSATRIALPIPNFTLIFMVSIQKKL
jgi:hypothetical protein